MFVVGEDVLVGMIDDVQLLRDGTRNLRAITEIRSTTHTGIRCPCDGRLSKRNPEVSRPSIASSSILYKAKKYCTATILKDDIALSGVPDWIMMRTIQKSKGLWDFKGVHKKISMEAKIAKNRTPTTNNFASWSSAVIMT